MNGLTNFSMKAFMLAILVSMNAPIQVSAGDLCNICKDAADVAWPYAVLKNDGTTCSQMAVNMALLEPDSEDCAQLIYFWRETCCGPNEPINVPVAPTPAPVVSGIGSGPNPICHICRDGDFPGSTTMVINMLYIGAGDCEQFYNYGLQGEIPGHLCDPLQYFAYEPCGCGDNPGNQAPPGPSPTSSGYPPTGVIQKRKSPDPGDDKDNMKLSKQRGGAGGYYVGRRFLKGQQRKLRLNET